MATVEALVALAAPPEVRRHRRDRPRLPLHRRERRACSRRACASTSRPPARTGLPLIVHARDADADIGRILAEEHAAGPFACVMHCFTSGARAGRDRARARLLPLDLRHRHLPQRRRAARHLRRRAARPAARRDRQPLPRAAAAPRQAQRARLHRRHRPAHRRAPRPRPGRASPPLTSANFDRLFAEGRGDDRRAAARRPILGCGSSAGVPRIGGDWGDCDPANPKNRRSRCSLLVERTTGDGTTRALIDTTPDLRAQLLAAGIGLLDGVVFTHPHADHIHGIDDLRTVVQNRRARLPVWADADTAELLISRFAYVFVQPPGSLYPPILDLRDDRRPLRRRRRRRPDRRSGRSASRHGRIEALGFRIERLRLPARRLGDPRRRPGPTLDGPRHLGRSTRCAASRTRPTPTSRRASPGSPAPRPRRGGADQHAQRPRLRDARRRAARRASSPPTTASTLEIAA